EGEAAVFVRALETEKRAQRLIDGRLIATEDADLYARIGTDEAARKRLVQRYLTTHGPATEDEPDSRLGVPVHEALLALERDAVAVPGEFTRGRHGLEWVDARVLEEIHRATLTKLRREIEPRTRAEYAQFLRRWHGITSRDRDIADVL